MNRFWKTLFICFWILIFALIKLVPSESELLLKYIAWSKSVGAEVPINFAKEIIFPIPTSVLSLVTWNIPQNLFLFRLPNLVVSALTLGTFSFSNSFFGLLFAITNLWIIYVLATNFGIGLSLLIINFIFKFEYKSNEDSRYRILSLFLFFWLGLTSFPGWVFGVIWSIYKLKNRNVSLGLAILGISIFILFGYIKPNINLQLDKFSDLVNQRVRYETNLVDHQEPVWLPIKRIVYNKYYFWFKQQTNLVLNYFSLEKFAFPGQGDSTVSRNLWGSKNLAWLYFWQIPLFIFSFIKIRHNPKRDILILWGLCSMILGKQDEWLVNGIGIPLAMSVGFAELIPTLNKNIMVSIIIVLVATFLPNFFHFVLNSDIWSDNRPKVHYIMATQATKNKSNQITTILGRSFLYYAWINSVTPGELWKGTEVGMKINQVKFDHFEKPTNQGIYTGLPGEFVGNKKDKNQNNFDVSELRSNYLLLDKAPIRDSVSFGNGDFVWTVEVKN